MDISLHLVNRPLIMVFYLLSFHVFPAFSAEERSVKGLEVELNSASNPPSLSSALKAFKGANGATEDELVASYITIFKEQGKSSQEVINLIAVKLKENDPLYKNRGPKEVERLRGFMLASLSEIGINHKVIPILKAELSFGYHPYLLAAAARVAGVVEQPHQASLVPLLVKYLDETFKDDYVDIDNYGNFWPLKKATSVRLEVIDALEKIGSANPEIAVNALSVISNAKKGSFFYANNPLIVKARSAIAKISSANPISAGLIKNSIPVCCAAPASDAPKTTWLSTGKSPKQLKNLTAVDQNGKAFQLQDALGKPFIITFFYSRCDNPNKCSANIQNLALLRKTLEKEGLESKVSLFAITYEPQFDGAAVIKGYGEGRGVNFDENFKFLSLNSKMQASLIKDLGVLVNYGKGMVNHHGSQLFVFNKKGEVAKTYENTIWTSTDLLQDIKRLVN